MFWVAVFSALVAATPAGRAPVLAVAPPAAPAFPAAVSATVGAKLVELARDSNQFAVFDQDDIETILRMQKQGASPVMTDPVALGKLVAARKVLTSEIRRDGEACSVHLKITDVETGLVEAAKLDMGGCSLTELLERTGKLWGRLAAGELTLRTEPAGLMVAIDELPARAAPFTLSLPAGEHVAVISQPGYSASVSNFAVAYLDRRSLLLRGERAPIAALVDFEKRFIEGNKLGRENEHSSAVAALDAALRAGVEAVQHVPDAHRGELAAALLYVEGVRALEDAWIAKPHAEASGDLGAFCEAMERAAAQFAEAKKKAPATDVLKLSALRLARSRAPLALGPCSVAARFGDRVGEFRWPLSATAAALGHQAKLNRMLLISLKSQSGLASEQRSWLRGEEALVDAFERWASMIHLKDQLLRAPAETLPRFCSLRKEALGYAAAARQKFEGFRTAPLPLAERIATIEALTDKVRNQASLCP